MDLSEATSKVFARIREVDPENVTKIVGYLLLQEQGDQEMIRLALGPDTFIREAIVKAKRDLHQMALRSTSPQMAHPSLANHPIVPDRFRHFPFRVPPKWVLPGFMSRNLAPELVRQGALEDPELLDRATAASQRHRVCLPDFAFETCHYFNCGYCRHGGSCKYQHEQFMGEGYLFAHEDRLFSPGSLERLEVEIVEILRSRRGIPLTIASLPMIYYDKYGKVLRGEGYLTESQRQGKAGHSLTRLLSRLRSICLIDRPHGQHAVILAKDAVTYMESQNEKDDPGQANSSKSRQIYLTFPAESTFTEDDVTGYFNNYGQVEDVRIPCQNKRMFGFVTFVDSDTVNMILAKGNPHFVCGAHVLAKPYKEKLKPIDRKYHDYDHPMQHLPHYSSMEAKFPSYLIGCSTAKYSQNLLLEDSERLLEYERKHLAKLQFARKHPGNRCHVLDSTNGLRPSEDRANLQSAECFNYFRDLLNSSSVGWDDEINSSEAEYTEDSSSQGIHLPGSPITSQVDYGISTQT